MQEDYNAVIDSPLGKLGITTEFEKLTALAFLPATTKNFNDKDPFVKDVVAQLNSYFANPQYNFNLELNPEGTFLQKEIWQALRHIPKGSTTTYGSLAENLATNPRVVGNACRRNPIPIIIPCHRVVAANHLGGYSGATNGEFLKIKKWLLQHEGLDCE